MQTNLLVVGALTIAFGILLCFFGYTVWRITIAVGGFLAGYGLGTSLVPPDQWVLAVVIGVVVAVIASLLAYALYTLQIMLAGFFAGAGLGVYVAWSLLGGDAAGNTGITVILTIVGAIIGALVAFLIKDVAVIFVTALAGAAAITAGGVTLLTQLTGDPRLVSGVLIRLIAIAILAAIGFFFQYGRFTARRGIV